MAKSEKLLEFLKLKADVMDNLKAIRENLNRCVDEGMIDFEDEMYNQLLDLLDEASVSTGWSELEEVISKGKTLEIDVATFLANHGQTSLSLPWPQLPKH